MPWSGTAPSQSFTRTDGTRTGDTTWTQAKAASVNIVTSGHDAHDTDVKDGINACLKKDGGNTATADLPMGGFTLTNISAAGARTEPARFADVQDNLGNYISTVGGTADVITLTPSIAITAYVAGQRFQFLASGTNTGAVTVNISGVGAKDIKARDATFSALAAGTIISGVVQDIEYDGTRFQYIGAGTALTLTGDVTASGAGSIATTIANDAVTYAKMQNISATSRVLGRKTAAAGDTEECTLSEVLDMIGSATHGDIIYRGASSWARLGTGTAGQLLQSGGAGANLSWGGLIAATQAEQETGSSTSVAVTPGRQQYHPSACKAWAKFNSAGTVAASYNITSVTDNGVGDWTVNIATDMSSANYAGVVCGGQYTSPTAEGIIYNVFAMAAGTFQIKAVNGTDGTTTSDPDDIDAIMVVFFGDQA